MVQPFVLPKVRLISSLTPAPLYFVLNAGSAVALRPKNINLASRSECIKGPKL